MAQKLFEIQTDKIENGSMLMYLNTALTSWVGDLNSLTDGGYMFTGSNLESFNSHIPNLTDGSYMFSVCKSLTTFTTDLPSLTNGSYMFYYCDKLTSFNSDLSSLTNGQSMFSDCNLDAPSVKNIALTINKNVTNNPRIDLGIDLTLTSDAQVKKDLGLIKHKGWNVYTNGNNTTSTYTLPKYAGCTTIDEIKAKDANYLTTDIINGVWTEHLPDLIDCNMTNNYDSGMFGYCTTITSFTADLSSLVESHGMFHSCTNLTTFTSDLRSLTNGWAMFSYCENLTSFNSELPSLTSGWYMFNGCKNLTSFTTDLSSLEDGFMMFADCTFTSFDADLSSLTKGTNMFNGCTNLTSFSSALPNLTDGNGMFEGCTLDYPSMANLADTLPYVESGTITIGHINESDENYDQIQAAKQRIIDKGWTVRTNL